MKNAAIFLLFSNKSAVVFVHTVYSGGFSCKHKTFNRPFFTADHLLFIIAKAQVLLPTPKKVLFYSSVTSQPDSVKVSQRVKYQEP